MRYSEFVTSQPEKAYKTPKPPGFLRSRWRMIPLWYRMLIIVVGVPLLLGGMLFGYAFFIEPWMITVAKYEIESEQLPEAFDGFKIAFIADPHHGQPHSYNKLNRVIRKTHGQSPDLILLGGDYSYEHPKALVECFEKFAELDAPLGVYAILGNHDYWNPPQMRQAIADAGIKLLQNSGEWIEKDGARILLVGVDDLWCGKPSLEPVWQELIDSDYAILLSHNSDFIDDVEPSLLPHIDLMLSGHTHGGQVTLFGLYTPKKMVKSDMISGHFPPNDTGKPHTIISNGIGTSGLPLRFFARPQIVVVTLKKAK